jgi:radical SAM superfamily enzyme YgiQ (UPF0313 family)
MKVVLISPGTIRGRNNYWAFEEVCNFFGNEAFIMYWLAPPTIAGLSIPGVEVRIIDENLTPVDFNLDADLVGISTITFTAKRAYEIADRFRQRGVKVVMGGIHPTMMSEEALEHSDSIVIGEAENVWPRLIEDFKNNRLERIYQSENKPDMAELPAPRYDLLDSKRYLVNIVNTTRGCPFNCEFCTVYAFFGKGMRHKPVSKVVEEIKKLPQGVQFRRFWLPIQKTIVFADDNICGNVKYAKELFRALIPLNVDNWWGQASITIARDEELLELMSQSGCATVFIGLESVNPESLKVIDKRVNKVEEYKGAIKKIHSHGIRVQGSFILGSDSDDLEDFQKLVDFIDETNIFSSQITVSTPFPGTKLYKRLEGEGRLLHKDWDKYDIQTAVFKPKKMTTEELQNGFNWVVQQIYSYPALYKRMTSLWKTGYFIKQNKKAPFYQRILYSIYSTKYLWTKDLAQIKFILKTMFLLLKKNSDFVLALHAISWHHFAYSFPKGIDPIVYREKLKGKN